MKKLTHKNSFNRKLSQRMMDASFKGKVFITVGTRQVGKTTLARQLLDVHLAGKKIIEFNCDNPSDRERLENKDISYLKKLVGQSDVIFIDEAQKVKTIGQTLKLMADYFGQEKQIIATGSSGFNLLNHTQEPLTGRKRVFRLHPLSLEEVYEEYGLIAMEDDLETNMIYGMYPEVVTSKNFDDKKTVLRELISSYLYIDILEFQQLKSPDKLDYLLRALALQVGSEVSYNELAQLIGIDKNTVERYIDLLEKNFVIFRLHPYFTNKRKEISKSKKIYFYDTGLRNAIINNFNPLSYRQDVGAIWENFMIAERIKYMGIHNIEGKTYFWRDYQSGEIDWIEETSSQLQGYEFKWRKNKVKAPKAWMRKEKATFQVINKDNFFDWVF